MKMMMKSMTYPYSPHMNVIGADADDQYHRSVYGYYYYSRTKVDGAIRGSGRGSKCWSHCWNYTGYSHSFCWSESR